MIERLTCIMLVDDNPLDAFFHKLVIKKYNSETTIIIKNNGLEALEYLKSMRSENNMQPDLIFLDINMPYMTGWEFLKEYHQLDIELQSKAIIILTTSDYLDDYLRAKRLSFLSDFITKPLTNKIMDDVFSKYFSKETTSIA